MVKPVRLKRGQVAVTEVTYSKAELEALPEAERTNFFLLAQAANELSMLRVLVIQALNGAKGARAIQESNLGMAFMLARLLAGRIREAWRLIEKSSLIEQYDEMSEKLGLDFQSEVSPETYQARLRASQYFADPLNLIKRARDKVAFHQDPATVKGAFALLPPEFSLIDFHTGRRGTTFYGAADSLAAIAVSHITGSSDLGEGQSRLITETSSIGGDVETIIDGYLVAFCVNHFGIERFRVAPKIIGNRPSTENSKIHYLMDDHGAVRRALVS